MLGISESSKIFLLTLDNSLISGQLSQVVDTFQSPCGLSASPMTANSLLVADGSCVFEINLNDKKIVTVADGFQKAFDIAVSLNGSIGVTDVNSHKFHVLSSSQTSQKFKTEAVIGSISGCLDGPASKAQLSEPTGICFDCDTAIICCFGGRSNGCIKLYTDVSFACSFMLNVRRIYDAIGFLPKAKQNQLRQQGKKIHVPFEQGLHQLIDTLAYLQSITTQRNNYLHCATKGPEGTVYHISLEGFAETVKALEIHLQAFDDLGMTTPKDLNLYAFVNESTKEHGFAKHKQSGQYRHPTKKQYAQAKSQHEIELIKKTCKCPHSYHTNTFSAYQPTHASQLISTTVIQQYKKWSHQFSLKEPPQDEPMKQDLKTARMLNVLTKSRPTQNIRDLYRYKCGYGPCIIFQKETLLDDGSEVPRHYPDFKKLMEELTTRRGETRTQVVDRRIQGDDYIFVPGDIVVVNPGLNDGMASGDKWWFLQINKAHESRKTGCGCHVFGFWLDEINCQFDDCRLFSLLPTPVKIFFGSVVKNTGTPLVIPVNEITSGWKDGKVTYAFTTEYCCRLDELTDEYRKSLETSSDISESESSDDDDDDITEESHEVELASLTRRRTIRSSEGNTLKSYKDLAGVGFSSTKRKPRRFPRTGRKPMLRKQIYTPLNRRS